MTIYFNDFNPYCVKWLKNLFPEDIIDETDIWDILPTAVCGFRRAHFFAGVGGWEYALRLAGWPDEVPVWTGSCPCQPFSKAGKQAGFADERHVWPAWFWLIDQCQPNTVFGEQVTSPEGRDWLDLISDDLEGIGYTVRAATIPACSVGAPHVRERIWFAAWMADGHSSRWSHTEGGERSTQQTRWAEFKSPNWNYIEWINCADGKQRPIKPGVRPLAYGLSRPSPAIGPYGNAIVPQVAAEWIRAIMTEMGIK